MTLQVKAETFFGRKMGVVIPEMVSVAIWRHGFFEEDVCAYLIHLLRPGDGFIDIGGHFGFFSMLGCELVGSHGSVVTFEPMPSTRDVLVRNLGRHAASTTHYLVPAAAGAAPGRITFKDFGLSGSAFATSTAARNSGIKLIGEVEVEVRTLDSVVSELGLTALRLIKIDAENAEFDVVQGSLMTIRRLRPAIILEAGDIFIGGTRRVIDLVMSENYIAFEFRDWSLHLHEPIHSYGYQNLLMVPSEKVDDMVRDGRVD